MATFLPIKGAATEALAGEAHQRWMDAATKARLDLSGFRSAAPLVERIAWAKCQGLEIAAVLARDSFTVQHSTADQVRENVEWAGEHQVYPPPEYVCVDEGVVGHKMRRDGLERAQKILQEHLARTLLVFDVSRLVRVTDDGYAFIKKVVVEEGLRAIAVNQGVDTGEEIWKHLW